MKPFLVIYFSVALLWCLLITALGMNSIPDTAFTYNLGRNVASSVVWPVGLVKSPYRIYKWVVTPARRPELQPFFAFCATTTREPTACSCVTSEIQKRINDDDAKRFEAASRRGEILEPRLTQVTVEARMQCQ